MSSLASSGVRAERCHIVHNGIDPEIKPERTSGTVREGLGLKDGELLIGTVGSLVKRKRVQILLKTISILKQKGVNIRGLVVGAGPEEGALKEWAGELGISKLVTFTGFSTDPLSYISAMDVFLLTSTAEGLPRVILEAMLMGRPVVAANVTGPAELVANNKTGFLIDDDEAEGFSKKVSELLSSPELRARMGGEGKKRVIEKFSMDAYVEGVEGVFKEVFSNDTH